MEKTFTKYDKFTIYRDIGYALFTCTGIAVSAQLIVYMIVEIESFQVQV